MTPAEREAWLAERRTGIGSSDAPIVAGLAPWADATPLALYLEKTGQQVREREQTFKMQLGLIFEPGLAQLYADATGASLVKPPALLRHPTRPWQIASLDYQRADKSGNVELKMSDAWCMDQWGEPGSDEIPESYLVQVTHQMEVTGIHTTDVGVLIGTQKFVVYTVNYDAALAEMVTNMEADFWGRVQRRDPPAVDWSDTRSAGLVMAMNKPKGGQIVLNESCLKLVDEYVRLGQDESACKKTRDTVKARLCEAMGTAGEGRLPDGRSVVRKMIDRAGYTVAPVTYADFRVKTPKSKNPKQEMVAA